MLFKGKSGFGKVGKGRVVRVIGENGVGWGVRGESRLVIFGVLDGGSGWLVFRGLIRK